MLPILATCPEESHSSFCSRFSTAEFVTTATNHSSFTFTGPDKVAYSKLKHLPRSGIDFLLHIFNVSWSLHSFPYIWKTSSIIRFHKMGNRLDSPAFFHLSLSPPASQSFLNSSFYRVYFSFWYLTPFSLPASSVSVLSGLLSIKFFLFLHPFRKGLTNSSRALGQFSLLSTSPNLSALSGTSPFSTNLFLLASLIALLIGLNLSFLIGAIAWFFKVTKVAPFKSVEVLGKNPFSVLCFLFSSIIFQLLCLLPSAAFFRR